MNAGEFFLGGLLMSMLIDFLALPDVTDITEEVYINDRIGTFTVKPMTAEQHADYQKRCVIKLRKGERDFDTVKFRLLVVTGQTVKPNFSDAEFLRYSIDGPLSYLIAQRP